MIIFFGWKIKIIEILNIKIPEIDTFCPIHKLKHKFIVGKKIYTLYGIPLNYFCTKKNIFKICEK